MMIPYKFQPPKVILSPLFPSVAEPEPLWSSGSRLPAPGSCSTVDKTEEIVNDILLVRSNID